ncbi:MAG: hypothetical protein Q9190_004897 [Brigantiaea leucoxantha]
MQRSVGPEGPVLPSPKDQRSASFASDKPSPFAGSFFPSTHPDPAFVSSTAASDIVSTYYLSRGEDPETDRSNSSSAVGITVAAPALNLINAFLDQLLYSFLASSRSTSIASLRPAVSEVLRPRLAKDAIASADEELQEFLGGGDDEELSAFHNGQEPKGDWDLNTIWRRTRLRCMVYTRLGDVEEEDEEMWLERDSLEGHDNNQHRISRDLGMVSPAAAIFLTSILEFIAEQCLYMAGEASYHRLSARRQIEKFSSAAAFGVHYPTLEVMDMEKIAVNPALGRLWRSWKKRVRSPSGSGQRPSSREFLIGIGSSRSRSASTSRNASIGEASGSRYSADQPPRPAIHKVMSGEINPATIPLPTSVNDVAEIENPSIFPTFRGFNKLDDLGRPRSMLSPSELESQFRFWESSEKDGNDAENQHGHLRHLRSSSMPTPVHTPHSSPIREGFPVPIDETDNVHDARDGGSPPDITSSEHANSDDGSDSRAEAVTTMYDGTIDNSKSGQDVTLAKKTSSKHSKINRGFGDPGLSHQNEEINSTTINPNGPRAEFTERSVGPAQSLSDAAERGALPSAVEGLSSHSTRDSGSLLKDDRWLQRRQTEGSVGRDHANLSTKQGYPNEPTFANRASPIVDSIYNPPQEEETTPSERKLTPDFEESSAIDENAEYDPFASHGTPYPIRQSSNRNDHTSTVPFSPSILAQAKPAAKISDIRGQLPAVNTSRPDRASVQRVSPSPIDVQPPVGRTSTSSNRELRTTHSSSATTSQKPLKIKGGLLGRDSSDGNRQVVEARQSSDGSSSIHSDKRSLKTPRADETQRNFDQLIKSDETIQYTLTPQSVRNLDVSSHILV